MKITAFIIMLLACSHNVLAQKIEYNKRKNVFEYGDKKIAKLDSKSNGLFGTRSFFLQDMEGKNLIEFHSHTPQDSLLHEYFNWYTVEIPSASKSFTMPDPTEVNNEKYFAGFIIDEKLIDSNGALVAGAIEKFAANNKFDYPARFQQYNDSMKALVSQPIFIKERNMRKYVVADDMGRIGQGDVVIGNWKKVVIPAKYSHMSSTVRYYFSNSQGRIIAVITNGEARIFGKRLDTQMAMPSSPFIKATTELETNYATRVAGLLVERGLL